VTWGQGVNEHELLSDDVLVRRCLAGETELFEQLVKRYERLVYGFLLRKVGDVGVAQDLTQETFLVGYENLQRLKDAGVVKSWLISISANLMRDHFKRRKLAGLPEFYEIELTGLDPLQTLEQRERHELLYKAMQKLPERFRAVLVMRYLEEREYDDISRELGLSNGAAEVSAYRARKALAAALRAYMPDGV
jgi:RNA polymerase sigma factor (sigma-70 family)